MRLLGRLRDFVLGRADVDAALQLGPIQKGWRTELPIGDPAHPPRAIQFDPFSLVAALGYKDRTFSLSYDLLKKMAGRLSIVSAIVSRRVNQVASLSSPFRLTKSLGYEIKHRDPEHQTTRGEKLFIKQLESFVSTCGKPDAIREITEEPWDDFETFLKKFVRDSLTYDQATLEIVPDHAGRPCAFQAVDASSIRIAVTREDLARSPYGPAPAGLVPTQATVALQTTALARRDVPPPERIAYVQVFQGQIVAAFSHQELAFCIRNPRTDLYTNGYGFSELEQLIHVVTSLLWAEEYNRNFFKNGSVPKGILNFKTDQPDPESLEAFKAYWISQMTGVHNAWRMPMFQSEGLDYVNLQMNNRDMEFMAWLEYLIKLATSLWGMDPSEINFDITRSGASTPLFESPSERRVQDSKENGLRPLLRFIARMINKHILSRIDDRFFFDFVGLDELSELEKMQIRSQEITTFKTIDEIRAEADLPALPDGSGQIILNPVWMQFHQLLTQQQAQGAPGAQGAQGAQGPENEATPANGSAEEPAPPPPPAAL